MSIMDSIEKGFSRVNSAAFKRVNNARDWWELPKPLALLNLRAYRDDDRVALVPDQAIIDAQHVLWRTLRVMAEPGGAAALAALLCRAYVPAAGERVGVLVCGGNTAQL